MGTEFSAIDKASGAEKVSQPLKASAVPLENLGPCRLTGPCEQKPRDAARLRSTSVARCELRSILTMAVTRMSQGCPPGPL